MISSSPVIIKKKDNTIAKTKITNETADTINNNININNTVVTKKKKKKFILIHIGPSKTGTTTIQKESGENIGFIQALQQDNVLYVGKYSDENDEKRKEWKSSLKCMEDNIIDLGLVVESTTKLVHERRQQQNILIDKCYNNDNNNASWATKEMNIIDSNEEYSHRNSIEEFQKMIQNYYTIFVDYLQYDEIVVVGAYRRYYEWLPSTYKQMMHVILRRPPKRKSRKRKRKRQQQDIPNVSKSDSYQAIWEYILSQHSYNNDTTTKKEEYNTKRYNNIHVTLPLAQQILAESSNKIKTTTPTNTPSGGGIARVEILNYFQLPNKEYYNSITTELYCKILGMDRTPNTCRFSSSSSPLSSHYNKGSSDNIPYQLIINEAQQRHWVSQDSHTSRKHKRVESKSPIKTSKGLQIYHKEVMKKINKYNISSNNVPMLLLPLICPSNDELETFLLKSLQFEQLVMPPEFYNSPELGQQEHIKSFWKLAGHASGGDEKKHGEYCSIDIDTLFGNSSSWEEVLNERMITSIQSVTCCFRNRQDEKQNPPNMRRRRRKETA